MYRKVFVLFLLVAVVFCVIPEAYAQGKFKVAIVRMNSRPTYLEGQEGITSEFRKEGFDEYKVEFDIRIADDSKDKLAEIAKNLIEKKVDLIIALGIDAAKGIFKEVKDIPVVYSQILYPVEEGLAKSLESSGNNSTGTITEVDLNVVIKTLKQVTPLKRIGVLYSEVNSTTKKQLEFIKKVQGEYGFTVVPANISNPEEAGDVVKSLVGRVDGIYIGTGNEIGRGLSSIIETAINFKIPTISTASDKTELGLLLSVSSSRVKLGELAAHKAIEILNGKKPSDIPFEALKSYDIFVNLKTADAMGLKIPVTLLKAATKVIREK